MTKHPDPSEAGLRFAAPEVLRRLQWMAIGLAGVALVVFAALGRWADVSSLTLATGVSIFSFRGLQRVVAALDPIHDTSKYVGALYVLRFVTLLGILILSSFWVRNAVLGFLCGLSVIPAALIFEGLWQVLRTIQGKHSDGSF